MKKEYFYQEHFGEKKTVFDVLHIDPQAPDRYKQVCEKNVL